MADRRHMREMGNATSPRALTPDPQASRRGWDLEIKRSSEGELESEERVTTVTPSTQLVENGHADVRSISERHRILCDVTTALKFSDPT